MKILVLNRGSSSVKCKIYNFAKTPKEWQKPIWEEKIEWRCQSCASIPPQLEKFLGGQKIDCIGHRIVHGGRKYVDCSLITEELKEEIRRLETLAPLHNLADLEGIESLQRIFGDVLQFAVFDTAFHHTLPMHAKIYAGPYEWYEQGIQRYGFHGTSFSYCSKRATELLGYLPQKMVICHLGSGASLCAVLDGKSVDTTMGMTPLEGLVMDTRSGSIDPGLVLHLIEEKSPKILREELYEKSGLLGLSGISGDMRDILANRKEKRAQLALDVYLHQLAKMIVAMISSLGGIDVLVFTGGIGENAASIRKMACDKLSFLGVSLQKDENSKEDTVLFDEAIKILQIHTQEEFEIARQCFTKMRQQ